MYTRPAGADPTDFTVDDIPGELRSRPQWVCWRLVPREPKPTKVPVSARTGRAASSTDPATWAPFDAAVRFAREHKLGIGYVFSGEDPFVGIDLDKCRDPQTGALDPWAAGIARMVRSYGEVSPSETGVHLIAEARLAGADGRRKGPVEIYAARRFFCVTGLRIPNCPASIQPRQAELDTLVAQLWPPEKPRRARRKTGPIRINNEKFRALMEGDWQGLGYGSQSEADLALCAYLARATGGDHAEIDAQFRRSGLMREKWERRADYRERTIRRAIYDA